MIFNNNKKTMTQYLFAFFFNTQNNKNHSGTNTENVSTAVVVPQFYSKWNR